MVLFGCGSIFLVIGVFLNCLVYVISSGVWVVLMILMLSMVCSVLNYGSEYLSVSFSYLMELLLKKVVLLLLELELILVKVFFSLFVFVFFVVVFMIFVYVGNSLLLM